MTEQAPDLARHICDEIATAVESVAGADRQRAIDSITTARKYGQHFTFVPYAVPIFAANEYFRTSDSSYGWRRRWEVIDFPRDVSKLGHFDEQDLFDELPGIFNTAMEGLRRLMDRGRFAPPQVAVDATDRLHDSADDAGGEFDLSRRLVAHRNADLVSDLSGFEVHVRVDGDFGEERRRHLAAAHELRRVADLHVLDAEVERGVRRDDESLR